MYVSFQNVARFVFAIILAQQLIESDIQEKIWEPEEIQVLTVYPKTAEDYLSEKSLDELETAFFEQFNSTKYVSELFELIPEDVLYGWLIEQFEKEFTLQELKEVFEDEQTGDYTGGFLWMHRTGF